MGDDDNTYLICPKSIYREDFNQRHALVKARDADEALAIYLEENEQEITESVEYWVIDVLDLPVFSVAMKLTVTRKAFR